MQESIGTQSDHITSGYADPYIRVIAAGPPVAARDMTPERIHKTTKKRQIDI